MRIQKPLSGNDVINSINLRFKQSYLEKEYIIFHSEQVFPLVRISALMSILIHLMYLPLDAFILGDNFIALWWVRLLLLIPMSVIWYMVTSRNLYHNFGINYSKILIIINGLVMSCSPLYFGSETIMYFVPGTIMVIMYGFVLVHIDFVSGTIITWFLVVSNIIVIFVTVSISPLMFNALEALNISAIILTIGAYQYEKISKISYFQSRQLLESEKQKHEIEISQVEWFEQMAHFLRHELHNVVIGVERSLEAYVRFTKEQSNNKYLVRSNNGLFRIRKILDSVSEASSLESSLLKDSSPVTCINIHKLLQEQLGNYQTTYPDNNFVFVSNHVDPFIKGRKERIVQMLDKIISNAVGYSNIKNPISIILSVKKSWASITIRNIGGLLPENKNGIFDLFVSLRKDASSTPNHHGYGLYIAKQIAINHNGNIEARNLPDNTGVDFIFTLPLLKNDKSIMSFT